MQSSGQSAQIIDGAKNPEQIPDEVAWLLLFKTVADAPSAPEYEVRAALLRRSGLSDLEISNVVQAANDAMSRISAMESDIQKSSLSMDQKTASLRARRDVILRDVVRELALSMSPEPAEKFRRHVNEHVKRRIRITP